jgi:hypothetical protein
VAREHHTFDFFARLAEDDAQQCYIPVLAARAQRIKLTFLQGIGVDMAIEYRGFRITVGAKADATDTQWLCSAKVEGLAGQAHDVTLPSIELTIPKLKIDVLMALSAVEHRAKDSVEEWYAAQPALA